MLMKCRSLKSLLARVWKNDRVRRFGSSPILCTERAPHARFARGFVYIVFGQNKLEATRSTVVAPYVNSEGMRSYVRVLLNARTCDTLLVVVVQAVKE